MIRSCEHAVPDVVTPTVVDVLEVVEIDKEQCGLLLRRIPDRERVLELLVKERAVGKAGQRVVERELAQLSLCFPLGRDVQEVSLR